MYPFYFGIGLPNWSSMGGFLVRKRMDHLVSILVHCQNLRKDMNHNPPLLPFPFFFHNLGSLTTTKSWGDDVINSF